MATDIVILGGGTGGTLAANRLRRMVGREVSITVVDEDDHHVYQPGLLFVPFGLADPEELVRDRAQQLHHGIGFIRASVDRVDIDRQVVHLEGAIELRYDVLVVATGARLAPEETEGLVLGRRGHDRVFTFYDLPGATALRDRLATMEAGRLVVNVIDLPIKCPVAPLEFCFLADWFLRERGVREQVELTYVTPLDGAFTKPKASSELHAMLDDRGIELVTEFNTGRVDQAGRQLVSFDDRTVDFDVAVVVPVHSGAAYVGRSPGLGDELDFVPTDLATLQSKAKPNIFALGDATNLPISKAGSVTHFEGDALTDNIVHHLRGEPLEPAYDGHTNCFIETGFHKAMLVDFNQDQEPVTGHFPGPIGLPLLRESRLNHLGKLLFQSLYWHVLLPGRDLPGIPTRMPTAGKHLAPPEPADPAAGPPPSP
jgi:sulfide:quinone oxidoreductase